jgi:hypothetical protein
MVLEGKFIPFGSVIPLESIPNKLRGIRYCVVSKDEPKLELYVLPKKEKEKKNVNGNYYNTLSMVRALSEGKFVRKRKIRRISIPIEKKVICQELEHNVEKFPCILTVKKFLQSLPEQEARLLVGKFNTRELNLVIHLCRWKWKAKPLTEIKLKELLDPENPRLKERRKAQARRWRMSNSPKAVQHRVASSLRYRLYVAIKKWSYIKDLTSCTTRWLVKWLEIQFKNDMSWENYGKIWHIDHIRPCASFDLISEEQQKECFHWSNLQPLYAWENTEKGSKFK